MMISQTPITPQDLRDDARNARRLAEIMRDVPSKTTLLALSQKFLDQAAQLESAMRDSSTRLGAENGAALPPTFGAPKYWEDRASEARSMLDQLKHPEARKAMGLVVENYERLANIAEEKEDSSKWRSDLVPSGMDQA